MHNRFYAICLASIALLCGGCGQTPDIAGDWYALVSGHTDSLQLRLTQDGKSIRGIACLQWGNASRDIPFTGMPVTARFPMSNLSYRTAESRFTKGGNFAGSSMTTKIRLTQRGRIPR